MLDSIKISLERLANEDQNLKNALLSSAINRGWERLFFGPISKNSWPTGVNRHVLFIETASSAWAHQLGLMKEEILAKIQDFFGGRIIEEIRFKVGTRKSGKKEKATPLKVSTEPVTLESLEKKYYENQVHRKNAGGKSCPRCGVVFLGKDKACPFCERKKEQDKERKVVGLLDQAPWINYQEAKKDADEITRDEFEKFRKGKRDRLAETMYRLSWIYLEKGFDKKEQEVFARATHDYVMLKTQKKPQDVSNKVVEKNLPVKVRLIWLKIQQDMTPQT